MELDIPRVRRQRLLVTGVVQGVGFRPCVYRVARQLALTGSVQNTSQGVAIEIEGNADAVNGFEPMLRSALPPLAQIESISSEELASKQDCEFVILDSATIGIALPWVPADIAVCNSCLQDTIDPQNRRFEYPFTNCTDCGPRYSILLDLPYDRAKTTMAGFEMCNACRAEYADPFNRRFHAQPNACPECGPQLLAIDTCGKRLPLEGTKAILTAVVNLLQTGGIVAWKGLGGYQLACDATNESAVRELRRRKHRNEKPFAVMVRDIPAAEKLCIISADERRLLAATAKPILLLRRRQDALLADSVAPGNPMLGVMLPYTPMHELLFRILEDVCGVGAVLVMTSGNMSEEPIAIDDDEARAKLKNAADLFVQHNRPIHTRVDDSVARVWDGHELLTRRARGYTPAPLQLAYGGPHLLACGAQQKSTLCLARDGFAIVSQHLGDLENYETLTFFEETLDRMKRLFAVQPEVVAHDLHPAYLTTQFAKKLNVAERLGIQHHHAHIASCMAEHRITEHVIGVAWDGTGFGSDGTIWGGEFLVADLAGYERIGFLRPVLLAGGDTAIREPWRIAYAYLRDAFDNIALRGLSWQNFVPETKVRTLDALLRKRIQTIETSSCGRLFDAVASLVGLHQMVSFEGQAAMSLEAIASDADGSYEFAITGPAPFQVDMRSMVRQIVHDVEQGRPVFEIATKFHNTLIAAAADLCARIRKETGLRRVCLSGGCFQNLRLLEGCVRALRPAGFEVFFQEKFPCNDGGIALGQAAIASRLFQRGA